MTGINRSTPWRTTLWGGVIVSAAALLYAGDAWLDARQQRDGERRALALLLEEFEGNRQPIRENLLALERIADATSRLADLPDSVRGTISQERVAVMLTDAHALEYGSIRTKVLDSLLEEREFDLVADDDLNRRLLAWKVASGGLELHKEWFTMHHDDRLEPVLREAFPIHLVANHSDTMLRSWESRSTLWGTPVLSALEERNRRAHVAREHCQHFQRLHGEILEGLRGRVAAAY